MTKAKLAIVAALAGAAILGAVAVGYSNARSGPQGSTQAFNAAEEGAIEEIVRNYLLDNPEVLIESLNAYTANERESAETRARDGAKANLQALLDETHGYVVGANPAAATVAVVELFDYHCSFCKRAAVLVKNLTQSDPSVKVVFREFPILRQESDYAAQVALASRAQGKYPELHFAMMGASGVLTKDRIKEIAASVGVDFNAIEAALRDPAIEKTIAATHSMAADMAIDGTPFFIVASLNGAYVNVVPGFDEEAVGAAIADAKAAAKKKK